MSTTSVETLAEQNKEIQLRLEKLEQVDRPILVPINTFAPRSFELIKGIVVLVEPVVDDSGEPCEYIASFTDGAISASGDTIEDSVAMLKDRMVAQYRLLTRLPRERLGRIPRQQLDALNAVMRRMQ
jgi:hypothetical protein